MALNIAITSKYNPFTYEDYIKPLEGYWEDYDKHEADLDKLATDTATLREVINSMSDGEEKTKYTGYLNSLDAQAGSLATSGLTSANRKALRELKNQYASLMPRLALAEEARRKDLADYTKRVNSGEYFMYNDSPLNKNVVDYLDGNLPTYNAGLNKQLFGQEVENVAKAYSSRIFSEMEPQEVEKLGRKFIQFTQEKGVNANLSDIEGSEQFSPILEELYAEAGVDNMNRTEAAKTKDFINRKFWEGLVYQKAVDYKEKKTSNTNTDPRTVGFTKNGETIIAIPGAGTWVKASDGSFRRYDSDIDGIDSDKPSRAELQDEEAAQNYYAVTNIGGDIYKDKFVANPESSKITMMDERRYYKKTNIFKDYASTIKNNTVKPRHATTIVTQNPDELLKELGKTYNGNSKKDYLKYVLGRKNDQIIFRSGNGAGTGLRHEWFGDNHINVIDTTTFFDWIDNLASDTKDSRYEYVTVLANIIDSYKNNIEHNAYKKAVSRLKDIYKNYPAEVEEWASSVMEYINPNYNPIVTPVASAPQGTQKAKSSDNED